MSEKNNNDAAPAPTAATQLPPVHGIGGQLPKGKKIRVAIVGVGNCAS